MGKVITSLWLLKYLQNIEYSYCQLKVYKEVKNGKVDLFLLHWLHDGEMNDIV